MAATGMVLAPPCSPHLGSEGILPPLCPGNGTPISPIHTLRTATSVWGEPSNDYAPGATPARGSGAPARPCESPPLLLWAPKLHSLLGAAWLYDDARQKEKGFS